MQVVSVFGITLLSRSVVILRLRAAFARWENLPESGSLVQTRCSKIARTSPRWIPVVHLCFTTAASITALRSGDNGCFELPNFMMVEWPRKSRTD
ncbi:uncharacterized protein EI90DRAFT_3054820 [Cantharellus anzutake]|uniref:uncharacterized protein n=1 Tax=Cantharellus anzutake TaxID=1750568 RepID=UPI0019042F17|nr:uncharacterized protein EI90DRAFT_3093110 [Cantharellus anzutake]XP_038916708.1 uncharacterized protein EI90DRAFT_3054820 [Cantharellus anzutake]KAF8312739.1 hypothetical protein EI90DRAFT_3093110 [Cantharellus anzutake]KAF8332265.1 hypothetical protein EI90DRAFT_3054820 [Cantharellus anzutake]